ncbi:MAG: MgtC/SapB family protein [Alphaproteobacteria bacterium]
MPDVNLTDIAMRLVAAIIVGGALGADREWRGKPAGVRTLALVALGAALVCVTAMHLDVLRADPNATSRVVQGIIQGVMTGVGFLGAGAVMRSLDQREAHNLTTAATVWVTAALGIACGLAAWSVVWIGVGLTLIVLVVLQPIDTWFDKRRKDSRSPDKLTK